MKRILASGVFDIVHPGHVHYLTEAKRLGDHLTVVVTSDGHATKTKRRPIHSQNQRATVVRALGVVDEVLIGADPYDLVSTTRQANPDIIVLGHDQTFEPSQLHSELNASGIEVAVVRITQQTDSATTGDILGEL